MAKTEIPALQGIDVVLFARKLSEAGKVAGQLIPYQTSLSFDPQRDSDTNPTKSGSVGTSSSIETDLEVEFINNWSKIADQLLDSLFNNEKMEFWIVYRKRRNKAGKYYAIYMRGTVNEDETDGDTQTTRLTAIRRSLLMVRHNGDGLICRMTPKKSLTMSSVALVLLLTLRTMVLMVAVQPGLMLMPVLVQNR